MKQEVVANAPVISDMKSKLSEILVAISWKDLSRNYFGKSSSWFYHKMDGIDGNGGVGGFTPKEADDLRNALMDLSHRIQAAAAKI